MSGEQKVPHVTSEPKPQNSTRVFPLTLAISETLFLFLWKPRHGTEGTWRMRKVSIVERARRGGWQG